LTDERGERGPRPETAPAGAPARLAAGRVGRAHGLDGSFYLTRPRSPLLRVGVTVTVAGRVAAIVRLAGTERRPIVRLEGVEDRSAAEALRGMDVTVDGEPSTLGDGEWWAHELEGCEVVDGDETLGTVSRLVELPSCEALEVRRPHGGELLVPMVKDAIRRIAPAQRRIEVNADFLDLPAQERRPREQRAERTTETDT
jgi:16S rRNA processing protein RimM